MFHITDRRENIFRYENGGSIGGPRSKHSPMRNLSGSVRSVGLIEFS